MPTQARDQTKVRGKTKSHPNKCKSNHRKGKGELKMHPLAVFWTQKIQTRKTYQCQVNVNCKL